MDIWIVSPLWLLNICIHVLCEHMFSRLSPNLSSELFVILYFYVFKKLPNYFQNSCISCFPTSNVRVLVFLHPPQHLIFSIFLTVTTIAVLLWFSRIQFHKIPPFPPLWQIGYGFPRVMLLWNSWTLYIFISYYLGMMSCFWITKIFFVPEKESSVACTLIFG